MLITSKKSTSFCNHIQPYSTHTLVWSALKPVVTYSDWFVAPMVCSSTRTAHPPEWSRWNMHILNDEAKLQQISSEFSFQSWEFTCRVHNYNHYLLTWSWMLPPDFPPSILRSGRSRTAEFQQLQVVPERGYPVMFWGFIYQWIQIGRVNIPNSGW